MYTITITNGSHLLMHIYHYAQKWSHKINALLQYFLFWVLTAANVFVEISFSKGTVIFEEIPMLVCVFPEREAVPTELASASTRPTLRYYNDVNVYYITTIGLLYKM